MISAGSSGETEKLPATVCAYPSNLYFIFKYDVIIYEILSGSDILSGFGCVFNYSRQRFIRERVFLTRTDYRRCLAGEKRNQTVSGYPVHPPRMAVPPFLIREKEDTGNCTADFQIPLRHGRVGKSGYSTRIR